ncbi:selenium-dependent xanthine dehydrogenase [Peptoniphilus asaccharolyticus]
MENKFELVVNGKRFVHEEDITLLRFLRDELKLKSVKDGCSQGACGTCTVIIDGKATKACVFKLSKLVGKEVITVEGLTDREKEVYTYAFAEAGAVQCGFCTPGMIMSAKGLLDKIPNPTDAEIKASIKGNICRCTGYVKIEKAIKLAAEIFSGKTEMKDKDTNGVGQNAIKVDAEEKILGTGQYVDDMEFDGMVFASCVRTEHPRAKVLKIDTTEAEKLEGVVGILRAEDVPNNKVGHIQQDWDVLIAEGDVTRCIGDAIVLVVAENEKVLEEAKALVKIEYEVYEPITDLFEALKEDAPKIHPNGNLCQQRHVTRGNAKEALENSKYVITQHYSTPFTEHAFMEPECAIAMPYKDGVKIYTSDQGSYDTRKETAIMFGWEPERVVVENALIGGGFGGKEDVSVQHIAALAAVKFDRIVKAKFTRAESLAFHPKRHKMEADFTVGCDENGIIQGLDAEIYFDTGAYASLCGPVLERACTHSVGPYRYENTDIRGYGVYTNNPPAGAFRGFGVCQSNFAFEMILTQLAEKVGISPWEIRYRNAIKPGDVLPNGQFADVSTGLVETLEAVKDVYEENKSHAGIACALKNCGVGVGLPDKGRARLEVHDGKLYLYAAASDIGQGYMTIALQFIIETLGISRNDIVIMPPNTETSPDSGTTSGSRQTLLTGQAVKKACELLKEDLVGNDLSSVEGKEYYYEYFEPTDPLSSDKPNPKSHIAYGYATHVVILDEEGKVKKVVAAHDSGKIVNPVNFEGQVEGGVLMSLGYALTEDLRLKDGVPTEKLGQLGLLRSTDVPEIETITVEREELLNVAYGAKGVGEISTIPSAAAVAAAYLEMDGIVRTKLPLEETAYSKPKKVFNK